MKISQRQIAILILFLGVLGAGYYLYSNFLKKPSQPAQPTGPTFTIPRITQTTTKITETAAQPSKSLLGPLGKIEKYTIEKDPVTGRPYFNVPENSIKPGTKIYMPGNGKVLYYSLGADYGNVYNLQLYFSENGKEKIISIFGPLKILNKKLKENEYNYNIKKGELIGEVLEGKFTISGSDYETLEADVKVLENILPEVFK